MHKMNEQERIELARVEYAVKNPWVFQYNFGHKELLIKYFFKFRDAYYILTD